MMMPGEIDKMDLNENIMKRYLFIAVLLLFTLVEGCKEEDLGVFMPYDEVSASVYFEMHPEFSEWYNMLERAGMVETYNFSTTPMTCFMVKNDSLLAYLNRKGYNSAAEMPSEAAKTLLQYHTIPNYVREFSSFRDGKLADSTSSGDFLACQFLIGDGIYMNREAKILKWDIEVVNGLLHELDRVMAPVTRTLYDYLASPRYSIMRELVERTETDTLLSRLNRTDLPLKCQRTLLAVSDSVYKKDNIDSFEKLAALISPGDTDYKKTENPLNIYMRYHILDKNYTTEELGVLLSRKPIKDRAVVDKNKGIAIPTLAKNKLVQVGYNELGYLFNTKMHFVGNNFNFQAKNGCVHELDDIMRVFEPEQIMVCLETTEAMNFQQLREYRDHDIPKVIVNLTKPMFTPMVTWQSSPANKVDGVGYLIFTRGDASTEKVNSVINGDFLYLNLGPTGWVELVTPPIPKGKYRISFYHKRSQDLGGNFNAYLDGTRYAGLLIAYTAGESTFEWSQLGQQDIMFYETESHRIKLTVAKQGELYWDTILFEPVN